MIQKENYMENILDKICLAKKEHVGRRKNIVSEARLKEQALKQSPARHFHLAIIETIHDLKIALIAEIKQTSPSQGKIINKNFDVAAIAKSYHNAGAVCLSVLTDKPFFGGDDSYIAIAKQASPLPILRKDFLIDLYQVTESRALGADCILIILAAVDDVLAAEMIDLAHQLGMDALIEIHDRYELDRALNLKSNFIGINNRNLKTLQVNLANTENLAPLIPATHTIVCESGIYSHNDIVRIKQSGVCAFLVGTSLMEQENVEQATKKLLGI